MKYCELPEDALVREINEELRGTVQIVGLLPHVQTNLWLYGEGVRHFVVLGFECRMVGEKPLQYSREERIDSVAWFDIDAIDWSATLQGTKEFVQCLAARPHGTLSAIYVRLEKHTPDGHRTHFYELYQSQTLGGLGTQIHERVANLSSPTPRERSGDFRFSYQAGMEVVRKRLKERLKRGYEVKASQPDFASLRLALGI